VKKDKANDLTSSNRCHDQCKDKNPRDVALLYQLISNDMGRCQHERYIRPSLERFPAVRFQGAGAKDR
jgi:hypothetical protein